MRKRHIRISVLTLFWLGFSLLFSQYFWWLFLLTSGPFQSILGLTLAFTHPLSFHIFPWMLGWRVYKCFYDSKFAQAINAIKWQSIVNPTTNASTTDWTVKYKTTLGNDKFIKTFVLIGVTVSCGISYVVWGFHYSFSNTLTAGYAGTVDISIILIFNLCVIYFYYKTPDFTDIFFVKKEVKRIFYAYCTRNIGVAYNISTFWNVNTEDKLKLEWDAIITAVFISLLPLLYTTYVSTYWVLKERKTLLDMRRTKLSKTVINVNQMDQSNVNSNIGNIEGSANRMCESDGERFGCGMCEWLGTSQNANKNKNKNKKRKNSDHIEIVVSRSPTVLETLEETLTVVESRSQSSTSGSDYNIGKFNSGIGTVNLRNVLLNKNAFDLFAVHLIGEYSIEILVSIIEFNQFLRYILLIINQDNGIFKDCFSKAQITKLNDAKFLNFSQNIHIPQSKILLDIISNHKKRNDGSTRAHMDYEYVYDHTVTMDKDTQQVHHNNDDDDEAVTQSQTQTHIYVASKLRSQGQTDPQTETKVKAKAKAEKEKENTSMCYIQSDVKMDSEWFRMLEEMGYQLYIKYVKVNSKYEINISSALRYDFANYFQNCENGYNDHDIDDDEIENKDDGNNDFNLKYGSSIIKLFELFWEANLEMVHLLGFSFKRFVQLQNVLSLKEKLTQSQM